MRIGYTLDQLARVYLNFFFRSNFTPEIMSLRPYFFILLVIFLSSSASIALLLFYMNPENDLKIAFTLMGSAVFLTGFSFLSFLIFFIKKIYYRGEVTTATMNASLRQASFLTIGGILMVALRSLNIFEPKLALIVWAAIACLEIMIQAVE